MNNFSIPLAEVINKFFDKNMEYIIPVTRSITEGLENFIELIENILLAINPLVLILTFAMIVWVIVKNKKLSIFVVISLF